MPVLLLSEVLARSFEVYPLPLPLVEEESPMELERVTKLWRGDPEDAIVLLVVGMVLCCVVLPSLPLPARLGHCEREV